MIDYLLLKQEFRINHFFKNLEKKHNFGKTDLILNKYSIAIVLKKSKKVLKKKVYLRDVIKRSKLKMTT